MRQPTVCDVIEVLNSNLSGAHITLNELNNDLSEFGMDSITFIHIVVALEEEFECEIPDSKLLISEMNTVNKIYEVLTSIERGNSLEVKNNNGESREHSASES